MVRSFYIVGWTLFSGHARSTQRCSLHYTLTSSAPHLYSDGSHMKLPAALFLVTTLACNLAPDPVVCATNAGVPPLVPRAASGVLGDVVARCWSQTPTTLILDVVLSFNVDVAPRVLSGGELESMLLLNEPDPSEIVLGTNAFYAEQSAVNQLAWRGITVDFSPATESYLRFSFLRGDTRLLPLGRPPLLSNVRAHLSFIGANAPVIDRSGDTVGMVWDPVLPAPEPGSWLLALSALTGLAVFRRRGKSTRTESNQTTRTAIR